jgi:hypothetical protein
MRVSPILYWGHPLSEYLPRRWTLGKSVIEAARGAHFAPHSLAALASEQGLAAASLRQKSSRMHGNVH